jgi:hypothetical protein
VAAAARGDRRHQAAWPVVKAPTQKKLAQAALSPPRQNKKVRAALTSGAGRPLSPPAKQKVRGGEGAGAPRAAAVAQLVAEGVGAMADGHKLLKRSWLRKF